MKDLISPLQKMLSEYSEGELLEAFNDGGMDVLFWDNVNNTQPDANTVSTFLDGVNINSMKYHFGGETDMEGIVVGTLAQFKDAYEYLMETFGRQ